MQRGSTAASLRGACRNIPQSLLLLSRAFKITGKKPKAKKEVAEEAVEALKATFNMLPEETIEDVEMERFKSTASLEKRLDYLRRVEQDIEDENATAKELAEAQKTLEVRACCSAASTGVFWFWLFVAAV